MPTKKRAPHKVLVLRTCAKNMRSYNGFKWPKRGHVAAPDWDPAPVCGQGLHGLLWGEGCGSYLGRGVDCKWLVVEVLAKDIVKLDNGCVKFPKGDVVYCGEKLGATKFIRNYHPLAKNLAIVADEPEIDDVVVVGDYGKAVARERATAGKYAYAEVGDRGTATVGNNGTAVAGTDSEVVAGTCSVVRAGDFCTVEADSYSQIIAGEFCHINIGSGCKCTVKQGGHVTAGESCVVVAGKGCRISVGKYSQIQAGEGGVLTFREYPSGGTLAGKVYVFYVGVDGVKPDTMYSCSCGKLTDLSR